MLNKILFNERHFYLHMEISLNALFKARALIITNLTLKVTFLGCLIDDIYRANV